MTTAQNSPHHGRRKFLVKGSSLALITSLPLKSSWAAAGCDGTVSGNLSGNTSSAACNTQVNGNSPDYWEANKDSFHVPPDLVTRWSDVFAYTFKGTYQNNNNGNTVTNPALIKILRGSDVYDRYLIAGYLNALNGHYPLADGVDAVSYAQILEEEAQVREADVLDALAQTWT